MDSIELQATSSAKAAAAAKRVLRQNGVHKED